MPHILVKNRGTVKPRGSFTPLCFLSDYSYETYLIHTETLYQGNGGGVEGEKGRGGEAFQHGIAYASYLGKKSIR